VVGLPPESARRSSSSSRGNAQQTVTAAMELQATVDSSPGRRGGHSASWGGTMPLPNEDDDELPLDTPQPRPTVCTGYKTKSSLEQARLAADAAHARHQIDYQNFGGDYHFPNTRKAAAMSQSLDDDYSEARWGPQPELSYATRNQGKLNQRSPGRGRGSPAVAAASSSERRTRRSHERMTGHGTHISISAAIEGSEEGSEAAAAAAAAATSAPPASHVDHRWHKGSRAGREGPLHRGERLPTPLYDDVSISTFAKPLSQKHAPI
jgi:hypothetical protein